MRKYSILGFIAGAHSCGAAYIVDGKTVAVIEEERLTRVKPHVDYENDFERYPARSLACLVERHGLRYDDVDVFASFFPPETGIGIFRATTGFEIPIEKYFHVDHHYGHAVLSYHMSGFADDTLVFCADASGGINGHSSRTYLGSGGRLSYIDGIATDRVSLGHFYAALTELVGFKRLKDEGKVVGLSGHGSIWGDLYSVWSPVLSIEGTKTRRDTHRIEAGGVYLELYKIFFELVGSKNWKHKGALQNIACTGQRLFEDKVVELIRNYHAAAPQCRRIALSGGIFANVKLNKRVNEMPEFDEVFVLPPMGDEGLALGCAVAAMYDRDHEAKPEAVGTMYLGNHYGGDAVRSASDGFEMRELDVKSVVDMIQAGKILGLYQGRSEHGPRALGNRSIVCEATGAETYSRLNGRLMRNDYMPFAPAVLDEDADRVFNVGKSPRCCRFMTMLVDTREEWRERIPTVVHPVDKTARIQIVSFESNPLFYAILKEYKSRVGFGVLVNTSFNVHEEPIVERPEEAFRHLRSGIVDALVTSHGIFSLGVQ